jgi:DNA polymerase-3 subunit epsilon
MRQIVLDTETTGFDPKSGNRLVEIGCIEMVDRKFTGRTYHQYINPEREVEEGAFAVHGISDEFLADKPTFAEIAYEFCEFVQGAELIIHNAPFDMGFLDYQLRQMGSSFAPLGNFCTVIDTLALARSMHPGQRNSLDALCKRYGIDNSHRELHGALLDSEILADVYLLMTGGQKGFALDDDEDNSANHRNLSAVKLDELAPALRLIKASAAEIQSHDAYLQFLEKKSSGNCLWLHSPEKLA